jgi:hypothetical protein
VTKRYQWAYLENPFVEENRFRQATTSAGATVLPTFAQAKELLPVPVWEGQPDAIKCYWKSWELAFKNLRQPTPDNGFIADYIDTAFSNELFMWDSVFILFFGRYGRRAFDFQRTLDNFYASQHPDGFICKELSQLDGKDAFSPFDPSSTGPNVLAWSEWEHYQLTGDRQRLADVFGALVAYHQWLRTYRTWPDGTYWANGISSGMDNQPRLPAQVQSGWNKWRRPPWSRKSVPENWPDDLSWLYHGHMGWIDTTLQQIFSARLLGLMAGLLGRTDEIADLQHEVSYLSEFVNRHMWDDREAFYFDLLPGGSLSDVKTVGAFWALAAGVVPPGKMERFIAHLQNPAEFNRPHRVPSLAADHSAYHPQGGYWLGSVWPPTNYMIMRGLTYNGYDNLAHEVALNHLTNVVEVWRQTGTLWENYAPDYPRPGNAAKGDFVGWGGLGPIAGLLEYVIGLRPQDYAATAALTWDIRLLDGHGVQRYPFGKDGWLDLYCAPRSAETERPEITARANRPVQLNICWNDGTENLQLEVIPDINA